MFSLRFSVGRFLTKLRRQFRVSNIFNLYVKFFKLKFLRDNLPLCLCSYKNNSLKTSAMYKTRNTGTGNGMWGTRGTGRMLYSGECHQTFRRMSRNIPRDVLKHSGECHQIFRGMSSNNPGNVIKHSGECRQTFWGIYSNIPGNVFQHSREYRQKFLGMLLNIPGNFVKHSGEYLPTFRGISSKIPGNFTKHSGECPIYFDGRELVEALSIMVVFSVALLIVCSVIF